MTVETFDAPAGLRRLIAEQSLTENELETVAGIEPDALRAFISWDQPATGLTANLQAFSAEESTRLTILAAQLLDGMAISDDERLKGILESLTLEFHLAPQSVARLAGLDVADIDVALSDPQSLEPQKKYEVAVRAFYLLNAVTRASNR